MIYIVYLNVKTVPDISALIKWKRKYIQYGSAPLVNLYDAEIFLHKPWRPMGFFICYGSTAIINILYFSVQGSTLDVRI